MLDGAIWKCPGMRAALGIAGHGTCSELHDLLAVDLWPDARDVSF